MFGIDGPEFFVILIVLIVVVGPKDLPKMLKAFGKATSRMRATANEFRRQFDDAMHEADLDDLQKTITDVTDIDPRKKLANIFDPLRDVAKDVKASIENKKTSENSATMVSEVVEIQTEVEPSTSHDAVTGGNEAKLEAKAGKAEVVHISSTDDTANVSGSTAKTAALKNNKKSNTRKTGKTKSSVTVSAKVLKPTQAPKTSVATKKISLAKKTTVKKKAKDTSLDTNNNNRKQ